MLMKSTSGADFINILRESFSYKSALSSFSLVTVWLCNFLAKGYRQKNLEHNVDEINTKMSTKIL
jgi:hypothetical protein